MHVVAEGVAAGAHSMALASRRLSRLGPNDDFMKGCRRWWREAQGLDGAYGNLSCKRRPRV